MPVICLTCLSVFSLLLSPSALLAVEGLSSSSPLLSSAAALLGVLAGFGVACESIFLFSQMFSFGGGAGTILAGGSVGFS